MPESPQIVPIGKVVSLEGISGCGKTYFLDYLKSKFPSDSFVAEVSDRSGVNLDTKIIATLRSSKDAFFRNGYPHTETLLLLALKTYDFERRIRRAVAQGKFVWEDRSIDTIAVYQSILNYPKEEWRWLDEAQRILDVAAGFRSVPDVTLLLHDDFETTIRRAEAREGRSYATDERSLLAAAHGLYVKLSAVCSSRFTVIDRRLKDEHAVRAALVDHRGG